MNKLKGHRGISNNGDFIVSPFALLWLYSMGLLETALIINRNN